MALPTDFRHRYGPLALVTGASSGIGEAFARALKSAGEAVARQRLDDAALDAQFVRAFQAGRTHEAG